MKQNNQLISKSELPKILGLSKREVSRLVRVGALVPVYYVTRKTMYFDSISIQKFQGDTNEK